MASGRVGGTRSRISGAVGNEVYTARRNSDGSYTQIVSVKAEAREDTLTYAGAKQRMIMSVIMRHMNLLTPFMNSFNEVTPDGTLSLQEFVRINVKRLQDISEIESSFNNVVWWPLYGEEDAKPASLILTEGKFMTRIVSLSSLTTIGGEAQAELVFKTVYKGQTWREYLDMYNWDYRLYNVFIWFCCKDTNYPSRYEYQRFNLRKDINLDDVITVNSFMNAWQQLGNLPFDNLYLFYESDTMWLFRWKSIKTKLLANQKAHTEFVCGQVDGKKIRSNATLLVSSGREAGSLQRYSFERAMQSWYDERI